MSRRNPNPNNLQSFVLAIILVLAINCVLSFLGLYFGYFPIRAILTMLSLIPREITNPDQGWAITAAGFSGVWLYQLVYVIPLIINYKRQREFGIMKGVIVGAIITVLISGSCFVGAINTAISK